jgi:hypothetical protein
MSKLRLGPILEEKPVKLTIELPGGVHRDLAAYCTIHAKETGLDQPLPPEKLVPAMIERFMAGDRAFGRQRSSRQR